ncbi:MAG: flagellar export chaperone FliS [Clostridiales bacterium]|nr:flagellar export chaperone FliS [Clostridiales bacterium]
MLEVSAYEKYQEQAVYTMTPCELIILLYEKAVFNINTAIMNINRKKICDAHNHIIKAQDIVLYLQDILDMKYPISKDIFEYYTFVYEQLVKANIQKDVSALEELKRILIEMKCVWKEIEVNERGKIEFQGKHA